MEKDYNTSAVGDEKEDINKDEPEVEVIDSVDDTDKDSHSEPVSDETNEALKRQLKELKEEKDEADSKILRIQAEYDNFKKRTQKEKQSDHKYKSQDMINELLPAIDNFDRALKVEVTDEAASFVEGMTMVYNQIKEALLSQGVEEIETVGKQFDPNVHHAVVQVENDEYETNTVLEEMQTGYMLKDRVIRPAMVKVNK